MKINKEKIRQISSKVWKWIKKSRWEVILFILIGALLPSLWDNVWYAVYYTKALWTEDFQSDFYAEYMCQLERNNELLQSLVKIFAITIMGHFATLKLNK